jgi:glycosyltransferase involved in cell wall biosynthesis
MGKLSSKNLRRLLMISYYWPPCGGPGSLRPVKFAKYLPNYGIEPIILTRKDIAYHSIDTELGKDLKNLKIYRTESLDPARILYILGMREYKPKRWQVPIKKSLNFPDNKIGWIPFAYYKALIIDFDYIFVTGPPFSSFITGYLLSKKTGKPLILDFRDAWLEFPFLRYENKLQRRLVAYWEKKVVKSASLIITVSENIKRSLIFRCPEIENRIFIIPNGYDPEDFSDVPFPEKFTIAYLGTIREERNPQPFLEAVEQFLKEANISSEEVQVKFIGHIEEEYLKIINKYSFTKTFGHLSYKEAIKEFCKAHVALMITTGDDFFFPSRQNEYLASGLPIICSGWSDGLSILKEAFENGYPVSFFEYENVIGMKGEIHYTYVQYKHNKIKRNPYMVPEYTRQSLTKKLVDLLLTLDNG